MSPSFGELKEKIRKKDISDDEIVVDLALLEKSWKHVLESLTLNVLADRYATETGEIFSPMQRIASERKLWVAVMNAQLELGMEIPREDIAKYELAIWDIDLGLIREIERKRKHDVKARIEAYVQAAGAGEYLHLGMTARDLTDNVEQMQNKRAAEVIFGRYVSVLRHLAGRAQDYRDIILTARSHHQAAQPTVLGRRFSMWAEELMDHMPGFEQFIKNYPLRGIKGPVGTQFDMLTLLGSPEKVDALEKKVAETLGFTKTINSPGQVYPRSLDYSLLSHLAAMSSACENFAKTMRLMAGYELVTEGFSELQTGSTAMPHKMNTRSSERICAFAELQKMYADGASRISGDQWEEGDVSESVIRRVILPDAFYTADGLCETTLTVLKEMGAYPAMIAQEIQRYFPFLATTEFLSTAVKAGIGREEAHEKIKKYAQDEARRMRDEGPSENKFVYNLSQDPLFTGKGITFEMLNKAFEDKLHFIGNAKNQIDTVYASSQNWINAYPEAAAYEPGPIL